MSEKLEMLLQKLIEKENQLFKSTLKKRLKLYKEAIELLHKPETDENKLQLDILIASIQTNDYYPNKPNNEIEKLKKEIEKLKNIDL